MLITSKRHQIFMLELLTAICDPKSRLTLMYTTRKEGERDWEGVLMRACVLTSEKDVKDKCILRCKVSNCEPMVLDHFGKNHLLPTFMSDP